MPTIYDFDELSLEGLEIGAISLTAERLSCDFGSGYGASAVVGHSSGLWEWTIESDCLPDDDSYNNLIGGLPRFDYYKQFYLDHTLGNQDVFEIDFRNRKYHASFVENSISGEMLTYDVFSLAGVKLRQRRVPGIYYRSDGSVFHPEELVDSFWGWYTGEYFEIDVRSLYSVASTHDLNINGNVTNSGGTQNGYETMSFNAGATNTGYLNHASTPILYNAFFVMKVREATFSNYAGILTGDTAASSVAMASGDSGTTKFYDHALGVTYRKNGVAYASANMQAPINVHGVCHFRAAAGIGLINVQIGKDRDFAGRFAEMDVGEIILCNTLLSTTDAADLEQYLIGKWGIT